MHLFLKKIYRKNPFPKIYRINQCEVLNKYFINYFANKKMKDSRLLEIFRQLSTKEIRALEKFVNSPFHNQRTDVVSLYQYLRQFIQNPSKIDLQKEAVFPFIFSNEPFSEKKLRYTMSFLYQAIKDFLAIQEFKSNAIGHQIAVVQSFRKKSVTRLFEQELKATTILLDKSTLRNQTYYFQNYILQNERYLFTTSQTRGEAVVRQSQERKLPNLILHKTEKDEFLKK